MSVSEPIRETGPYVGDGSLVELPFDFETFATSDISVVVTTTATGAQQTLAINTDYTVTLNADQTISPGGEVTLLVALASGKTATVYGDTMAYTRTGDIIANPGGFFPQIVNDALDRAHVALLQLKGLADRSLLVRKGETGLTLPSIADRAGKVLGFTAGGAATPITLDDSLDGSLRADLADDDPAKGAALSAYRRGGAASASIQTVAGKLDRLIYGTDYLGANDVAILNAAFDDMDTSSGKGATIFLPDRVWSLGATLIARDSIKLIGSGHKSSIINPTHSGAAITVDGISDFTLSGVRIGLGDTATVGIDIKNTSADVRRLRISDVQIAGKAGGLAGQVGIRQTVTSPQIATEGRFTNIDLQEIDVPVIDIGSERNHWLGLQIDRYGYGSASFTASISGTTMTVSAVGSGVLRQGQVVVGAQPGTFIKSLGTGVGGTGTYEVSIGQSLGSTALESASCGLASIGLVNQYVLGVAGAPTGAARAFVNAGIGNSVLLTSADIGNTGGDKAVSLAAQGDCTVVMRRPELLTAFGEAGFGNDIDDNRQRVMRRLAFRGAPLTAANFTLGAGWGSTAAVSNIVGSDQSVRWRVTAGGTGLAADPLTSFAFADGSFDLAPVILIIQRTGGDQITADQITDRTVSASGWSAVWKGTPVAGQVYDFAAVVL